MGTSSESYSPQTASHHFPGRPIFVGELPKEVSEVLKLAKHSPQNSPPNILRRITQFETVRTANKSLLFNVPRIRLSKNMTGIRGSSEGGRVVAATSFSESQFSSVRKSIPAITSRSARWRLLPLVQQPFQHLLLIIGTVSCLWRA